MTPQQTIDFQDLLQLIELIKSSSQFSEFKLRSGDMELELRRGLNGHAVPSAAQLPSIEAAPRTQPSQTGSPAAALHAEAAVASAPKAEAPQRAAGAVIVKAPMVGTVYRAPEPGAPAFVEIGARVGRDTTVCIIEVMKLMNSINADCDGVVTEILVKDGEAVQYGQDLFVISPL